MRTEHVSLLRCPQTGQSLTLQDAEMDGDRVRAGVLATADGGNTYPVIDFIPRFVASEHYTGSFGFQWTLHSRTAYDEVLGDDITRRRLMDVTKWPATGLDGEIILEAGSGSGRFTELLLETGATVVSFDFSRAVEATRASNGDHPNLLLVQADIFSMPFAAASFDKVFCLGVLQHTPDPRRALLSLAKMGRPGASIVTDIYLKTVMRYWLNTRYWVRPLTRKIAPEKLYPWVDRWVRGMWPVARLLRHLPPRLGEALTWRLLIADYSRVYTNLSEEKLLDLAVLDTFDMLSPAYDIPASPREYQAWHEEAGVHGIEVLPGSNGLIGRGVC